MKRFPINLILISSIFLFFSHCKKEIDVTKEIKVGDVRLSNSELRIVPYQLNDTLIFKDSLGNSQLFIVESRQIHVSRAYESKSVDETYSNNEPIKYCDIETLQVFLSNSSGNGSRFKLHLFAPLSSSISNYHINKNSFIVGYNLEGPTINSFQNYIDTTDFYYTLKGESIPYYPAFTILNNTYNDVYKLTNRKGTVYYNTTEGIVGFRTEDKKSWYLDN